LKASPFEKFDKFEGFGAVKTTETFPTIETIETRRDFEASRLIVQTFRPSNDQTFLIQTIETSETIEN
jgi:hypothetical protein